MIDYKQAGVDIEAGDQLVRWLQDTQPEKLPHQERLVSGIGGFASLFKIGFPQMKDPCLVTCTDGVGTKLKVASYFSDYSTVGQDLVAMCVNDMICGGAQPLLFLDYYATGQLELEAAKEFLGGVRQACLDSDCLLIGGETAEMPGVYAKGDFDCAGFAVGVVDREKSIGAHRVQPGQKLIGIKSSGFHSNGFSLLRRLFEDDMDQWKEALLEPTALYVKLFLKLLEKDLIQSAAHITGGGLDNLLRVLPKGVEAQVKMWKWTPEYLEVQKRSGLERDQMLKTFNCGIGMILAVDSENVQQVTKLCEELQHEWVDLGELIEGESSTKKYTVVGDHIE